MIKLIVLDVDGCMTDGGIIYTNSGEEIKKFDVKDGFAIVSWRKLGGELAIITGRDSKIVENRAAELGIKYLYQGVKDKKATLEKLLEEIGISFDQVAAIGDDLNDYKLLSCVGKSFTPNDGADKVKGMVDYVLTRKGGDAAVREMIEIVIKENGQMERFLELWI
ncbi:HAD-IIIA family hydrolase [Sulfurimonas sp. HSL-1716]|uniref:KdsC family phosphatase n=1 Tax=Hydrocurvibacter sulfurireducens TaxID=3131937 RepID=UPI0031F89AA1